MKRVLLKYVYNLMGQLVIYQEINESYHDLVFRKVRSIASRVVLITKFITK